MAIKNSKKIKWLAYDHIREKRSADWFWIVGTIAIGMTVLAIFFDNILFAIFILLATFTSFLWAHSAPRILEYELSRRGMRAGEIIFPFSSMESFWIVDEDGYERDRILFKSKKIMLPMITIPLGENADMEEVREFLLEFLPEEELHEPISEYIMHILGF